MSEDAAALRADRPGSTASERIAAFIVDARYEHLPGAVVEKAKAQIVYLLGLALVASSNKEAGQVRAVAPRLAPVKAGASVIGERFRLSPSDAAFANATLVRALWRDDVIFPAAIHAGVLTLPAALAIGEARRVSGRELVLAVTLGYEVLGKLGSIVAGRAGPMPQHASMIFSGYGSVTAAGRLLQLDRARMANALGFAANLGMGVPEGGMTDHYYGLIARNGTFSALLAHAGAAAYGRATIEGGTGLYRSFYGEVPAALPKAIEALGSDWEILKAEYKFHHGTVQNIVAITLLLELAREHAVQADQVASIEAFLSPKRKVQTEALARGPFDSAHEAYVSVPYALSRALLAGKVTDVHYTQESMRDTRANRLMQRITATFADEGHDSRHCRLKVHLLDGRTFEGHSDAFETPFPPSAWGGWLREHGGKRLPASNLRRLVDLLGDLERVDDVATVIANLVPV